MRLVLLITLFLSSTTGLYCGQESTIVTVFTACTGKQTVTLSASNPTFLFNSTQISANQNCQWNFTFPVQYAAEIKMDGWNMDDDAVTIFSQWGDISQSMQNHDTNESIHVMWPPTYFQITITTSSGPFMIVSINIILKQMSGKVVSNLNTAVNQQPQFFKFTDWTADTAITVSSKSDSKKLILATASPHDVPIDHANIFVYSGYWGSRQLLGTLYSLVYLSSEESYTSTAAILTLYRAMDSQGVAALIVNDYDNMKNVKKFSTEWYDQPGLSYSFYVDGSSGLAAVTVFDASDGIYLEKVNTQSKFTPPVKLLAGGMIRDYDTQGTLLGTYRNPKDFDDRNYPQFVSGVARTFVQEQGMSRVYYTTTSSVANDSVAFDGRNGFVMSDNYGFSADDQNSQDFVLNNEDGNLFAFEYTINESSPNADAYLKFVLQETATIQKTVTVDLHNVTTPATFNLTALAMTITIFGGSDPSMGTFIPYRIYDTGQPPTDPPTVKTTRTTSTSTSSTWSPRWTSTTATAPSITTQVKDTVATTHNSTTSAHLTTSVTTTKEKTTNSVVTTTATGTTISSTPLPPKHKLRIIIFLLLIVLLILCLRYRIRRGKYRKFWAAMSGVLPIAVKVDEWELGDKQLEIFEDKELGRGAFGIVYEGELYGDRPVDRIIRSVQKMTTEERKDKVAVKRLPLNADSQARYDFTEEISFMKKLGYHPHILGMIGCITTTSMPLIVLDYCEHGDLLSWIRKQKYSVDMKLEQLLSIAWQISDGLCYLKSINLIHRDLAARNILLTAELVAKISDFGLCRKPENSDDSATYLPHFYVSRGGRLPVKWLAPESLRDFQFSFKTDLWSYGVILWEMYTFGDVPFGDVNPLNLFELLESGERLPQGAIAEPMYKLMLGCWDAVPGKRTPIEQIKEMLRGMMTTSCNFYGYLMMSSDDGALKEDSTAPPYENSIQTEEI